MLFVSFRIAMFGVGNRRLIRPNLSSIYDQSGARSVFDRIWCAAANRGPFVRRACVSLVLSYGFIRHPTIHSIDLSIHPRYRSSITQSTSHLTGSLHGTELSRRAAAFDGLADNLRDIGDGALPSTTTTTTTAAASCTSSTTTMPRR